jgi:hypothetical protein
MYSHLLPGLADERGREIRQDAIAASLARRARPARPGHRPARAATGAPRRGTGLIPRTARS